MKTILKIGLVLVAAFFIFLAGLSIGFAGGTIANLGSPGRLERAVNERVIIEQDIDRLVEDIVVDEAARAGEFGRMAEEIVVELEDGEIVVERNGRFGPDITVIPPVPPVPEIPPIPDIPAAPIVVHHGPPRLFGFIGGMIRMFFAVVFILIGVWLIVRRNRQPVEKAPKA
jgi:hypothetical protein